VPFVAERRRIVARRGWFTHRGPGRIVFDRRLRHRPPRRGRRHRLLRLGTSIVQPRLQPLEEIRPSHHGEVTVPMTPLRRFTTGSQGERPSARIIAKLLNRS
jgi:hypothetical protein